MSRTLNYGPSGLPKESTRSESTPAAKERAAILERITDVLCTLEDAGHPASEAAERDPALNDSATAECRLAFLAKYEPIAAQL